MTQNYHPAADCEGVDVTHGDIPRPAGEDSLASIQDAVAAAVGVRILFPLDESDWAIIT